MLPTSVKVGHVELSGWTEHGFLIEPDGFRGWDGSPASRREDVPRVGGHGSFRLPVFKTARLVTISGWALADSESELSHLADLLMSLGVGTHRMTVQTVTGSRWSDVQVEGEIMFDRHGDDSYARFQLQLFAADPFKYGERRQSVSTGSSVSAFHYGNAEAWPSFEVTGFTSGYRILGPDGAEFRIDGSRAASAVDVIDFRTGLITRNGQPLTRASSRSGVWPVPAARSVSWRVTGAGSGRAVATVTDTWI